MYLFTPTVRTLPVDSIAEKVKSRRKAYRYKCKNHTVCYKTAIDDGTAKVTDLSTNGCAFIDVTCPVSLHEKVLIIFNLEGVEERVEAAGRVVRLCAQGCAIEFTLIDEATKRLLRLYFAGRLRQ